MVTSRLTEEKTILLLLMLALESCLKKTAISLEKLHLVMVGWLLSLSWQPKHQQQLLASEKICCHFITINS